VAAVSVGDVLPGPGGPSTAGEPSRGRLRVTVEGSEPRVIELPPDPALSAAAARSVRRLSAGPGAEVGGRFEVVVDGWRFEVSVEPAARAALRDRVRRTAVRAGAGRHTVRAQIPGRILHVWAAPGQAVEAGARLCSLEAMKMENEVRAPHAGTIERVSIEPGARVEVGDELVVIA
jgi:biotin carboxyl carrier protein